MADPGRIPGQFTVPNCIQVRLIWTGANGRTVYNVLHGQVAAGFAPTAAIAQSVYAALIASAAWAAYQPLLPTTVNLQGIDLKDLRTLNNPVVQSTGAASPGTSTAAALPAGVAFVITQRTAQAGRSKRGRMYLPGWAANQVATGGVVVAGAQTAAVNLAVAVQTALSGQSITLALMNPARQAYTGRKGAAIPARAANVVPITQLISRTTNMNSQRRRIMP